MEPLRFEWDPAKARQNRRKHGVSFEEARTAFLDEHARVYFDPDHSEDEDRFILLGMGFRLRVLVVCHCHRESESLSALSRPAKPTRAKKRNTGERGDPMRAHYDFAKMKGRKNPYARRLKKPITIRLDPATVAYFKALALEVGMPYQNLINLYLRECALKQKRLTMKWAS